MSDKLQQDAQCEEEVTRDGGRTWHRCKHRAKFIRRLLSGRIELLCATHAKMKLNCVTLVESKQPKADSEQQMSDLSAAQIASKLRCILRDAIGLVKLLHEQSPNEEGRIRLIQYIEGARPLIWDDSNGK